MADISMQREHDLSPEEARDAIERLANKLTERLGGTWDWEGDVAVCASRGANARVSLEPSTISIDVTLPRAFKPFRRRMEGKIEEVFERTFRRVNNEVG